MPLAFAQSDPWHNCGFLLQIISTISIWLARVKLPTEKCTFLGKRKWCKLLAFWHPYICDWPIFWQSKHLPFHKGAYLVCRWCPRRFIKLLATATLKLAGLTRLPPFCAKNMWGRARLGQMCNLAEIWPLKWHERPRSTQLSCTTLLLTGAVLTRPVWWTRLDWMCHKDWPDMQSCPSLS